LHHEYRTPVNHIVGYTELLMEEAAERHLESLLPVFGEIHDHGRNLLASIQDAFSERVQRIDHQDFEGFKENLRGEAVKIAETVTSLIEELERGHRQTLADLDVITWAVRRLTEITGQEWEGAERKRSKAARHHDDGSPEFRKMPRMKGGKILIADDDAANRSLLKRRLECEGHEVVEAANGLAALEALTESSCDLVLLDIMMPDLDGFETLARIKSDARFREVPVIMISALDELRSVVRCIEMGAEDYLAKPFNRVLLRARIGASLEKKRLRDRERHKTNELEHTLRLLEQAQEQLSLLASQDALTELANRRAVDVQLDQLVRTGNPFTAIYLDLNGFKKINDTYGHAAGDDLLRQVGKRLRSIFRANDFVARWGGDEFIALVDGNNGDPQIDISRIARCLADDFLIGSGGSQQRVRIEAAVGVAAWKPGDTMRDVIQRADFAMYEAKLRAA
jgi:diguanylate cyclase (GGDEF)-like protein